MAKNKVNTKVETNKDDELEELKQVEAEILQNKVDEYFKARMEKGLPYTLEGICLHLDIEWDIFIAYLNKDDELSKIIKKAYLIIKEARVVEVARVSSISNVDGNWKLLKNMNDYGCKYEEQ